MSAHGTLRDDLTGRRFGRLRVLSRAANGINYARYLCRCDCGIDKTIGRPALMRGQDSCGCLAAERISKANRTHGLTDSRVYRAWRGMRNRCSNPNVRYYADYGGRGIAVCERWHIFENFLADMGEPPPMGWLERIDNDGNYTPENCRWATPMEQANNRRNSRWIEYRGERRTLMQWARLLKLPFNTLWMRLDAGWSIERTLGTEKLR